MYKSLINYSLGGGAMDAFYIVLLFMALLLPGFILGKAKLLQESAMISFSNVLMYVAMPFLVFVKLLDVDFKALNWFPLLLSATLPILLFPLLAWLGKICCKSEPKKKRAQIFCATFPNCGFLGIPLAGLMFPTQAEIVLYVSVFNVVCTFLLLTLGVYILSGERKNILVLKTLISPIFLAILLGVVISFLRVKENVPVIYTFANTLAQLCTPLSMISLGFELSKIPFFRLWKYKEAYLVSIIKLLLSPLCAFLILLFFKFCTPLIVDGSLAFAIMLATATSTAASAPAMAKKYALDAEYTATLTLVNTLLFTVTLPLVYLLFKAAF